MCTQEKPFAYCERGKVCLCVRHSQLARAFSSTRCQDFGQLPFPVFQTQAEDLLLLQGKFQVNSQMSHFYLVSQALPQTGGVNSNVYKPWPIEMMYP